MVATFTTRQYNHTARLFLGQQVDINNLIVMLLDATGTFDATNVTLEDVAGVANAKEVDGNGWTTGGELFANVVAGTATTDDATLTADEIRVRATGGNIGPAYALVVYDGTSTGDKPLFHVQFSEAVYAGEGTDFLIPGTILNLTYTAP